MVEIGPASGADAAQIRDLLVEVGLPAERIGGGAEDRGGENGNAQQAGAEFFVAREPGSSQLTGCVGLETYGRSGLLRSLAVAPGSRGRGISHELVNAVVDRARGVGLSEIIILTTDAVDYFRRIGFAVMPRSDVEPEVRDSWQFVAQVCETAVCLRLVLEPDASRR